VSTPIDRPYKPIVRALRIGPMVKDWVGEGPEGLCSQCGGQCDGDDCGLHAAGCIYGGPTKQTAYWMIADGCYLYHGEGPKAQTTQSLAGS